MFGEGPGGLCQREEIEPQRWWRVPTDGQNNAVALGNNLEGATYNLERG